MNFLSSLSLLIFGTTKVLPSVQIQFKKSSGLNIEKVCYRYGHESIATKEICKKPNEELKFSLLG